MGLDTGHDLLHLAADLYLRTQQLTGFLYFLAGNDLPYLELQLFKIIKGNFRLWLDIYDCLLLILSPGLIFVTGCFILCFFHRRMQFFHFIQHLFHVQSRKQDLRFFRYPAARLMLSIGVHSIQTTLLCIQLSKNLF